MMNNYAWALIIEWKRKIFIYFINFTEHWKFYLVSRFIIPFSFCSSFNLEAAVVKTDEIKGSKQLFTPYFLLIEKKYSKIIITT